jgi:hypothetical protein
MAATLAVAALRLYRRERVGTDLVIKPSEKQALPDPSPEALKAVEAHG